MKLQEEIKNEKEREIQRINDMRRFYEAKLLRKYILGTFFKLKEIQDNKLAKACKNDQKNLKRFLLNKLRTATQICQFENEKEERRLTKIAVSFLEFNLSLKVYQSLQSNIVEERQCQQFNIKKVYNKHL